MKSFTQYLNESKKSWKFKIKTIHELTNDQADRIDSHLVKYDAKGLSAAKKSILQSTPRDFPGYRGYEVFTYEFTTNLIASGFQIQNEIQKMLGLRDGVLKVKGEHEPDDIDESAESAESVLADDKYSEAEKVDSEEFYGDKYNTKFVQELLKLRKNKEKDNE